MAYLPPYGLNLTLIIIICIYSGLHQRNQKKSISFEQPVATNFYLDNIILVVYLQISKFRADFFINNIGRKN